MSAPTRQSERPLGSARTVVAASTAQAGFIVILIAQFLMVLDTTVVYVALPTMARDLGLDGAWAPWVMDAYLLGLGGFLLVGGALTGRIGRRRQFLWATVAFGIASLLCAVAGTGAMLVAGRFLQGIAAALVTPAAMALIGDLFTAPQARRRAIATFAGLGGIAGASGSLAGGVLMLAGWQWVFLVNVPLVLAIVVAGARILPAHPSTDSRMPDWLTALMITAGLVLVIAGLGGVAGGLAGVVALLAIGFALLGAGWWRQRVSTRPLVPPGLLARMDVRAGNALTAIIGCSLFAGFYLVTLHLQGGLGFSPLIAGLLVVPLSLALYAGSRIAGTLLSRHETERPTDRPRGLIAVSLGAQALGMAALWLSSSSVPASTAGMVAAYVVPGVVWAAGVGVGLVAGFTASTAGLPDSVRGPGSGLANVSLQMGGAVGVAAVAQLAAAWGVATAAGYLSGGLVVAVVVGALWKVKGE